MEELLEYVARKLVDKPEDVRVRRSERDGIILFELRVAPEDVGKVIGKHGRVARALRTLVRAGGAKTGQRMQLEIIA